MSLTAKSGYKQSEIGEIPEVWDCLTVQQLIDKGAISGHLDGNHGELYPRSHEFKNFGVPYIGANNFYSGQVDLQGCKFLSEERAVLFKKGVAKDGDVLFAHNATVGPVAKLKTSLKYVILSTTATYFRVNGTLLNNDYLMHYMRSELFSNQYSAIMSQSTRNQVPITAQRKLFVVVPPIEEQSKIASSLSVVDALINNLDQLITKKRDIQQATMQQLLTGQRRLPGFSGEWEETCLGGVVERFVGGGTPSRHVSEYWGGDISWVTVKDFATFSPRASQERITLEGLKSSASSLISAGTLITSTRMALGKAVIYQVDVAINQDLKALFIKPSLHVQFLYYWFRFKERSIDDLGSGSTVKGLSLADLRSISFLLPSLEEQQAISSLLLDMDSELAALESRRDKARKLKQGMMQELLTGRVRLR